MLVYSNFEKVDKLKGGIKLSERSGTLLPYCGALWSNLSFVYVKEFGGKRASSTMSGYF
jgi:hypothetical protein